MKNPLTWILLALVVCFIGVQMNYLNKALDVYDTSVVTPILYVIFTSFVIVASAVLFKEWGNLATSDVIGNMCGFFTTVAGVFLLQSFKDVDLSSMKITPRRVSKQEMTSVKMNDDVNGVAYRRIDE